jgi:hypothetical protein
MRGRDRMKKSTGPIGGPGRNWQTFEARADHADEQVPSRRS